MNNSLRFFFMTLSPIAIGVCGNSLFCSAQISSQQKDSAYYIQLVDYGNHEAIPFASVIAKSDTLKIGTWTTDLDGIIKIKKNEINRNDTHLKFEAIYVGYEKSSFNKDYLRMNDTVVMQMKSSTFQFETVYVIDYKIPLIDPEPPQPKISDKFKKKKKVEPPKPVSIYSQQELDEYDSLKNGTLFKNDTIENKGTLPADQWFKLFQMRLKYPPVDRDNDVEGTIYFKFTLDENGNLKNIVWVHGESPAASLEVARILHNMPGIAFEYPSDVIFPDDNPALLSTSKKREPMQCLILVRFDLQ